MGYLHLISKTFGVGEPTANVVSNPEPSAKTRATIISPGRNRASITYYNSFIIALLIAQPRGPVLVSPKRVSNSAWLVPVVVRLRT